ncbi:polysaccharide deacetylase family protein [Alkaliphilus sp. MSJ-5]|uniref:Polysaccharide deacetylase family protein n=1 Tax=Alkaliphilus flagellatus TaxID=2841507 RepID=A0ABS6G3C1_9FIRM|nr:polysaccharide deacetylase family protein [Alkaliphilus flagellatus]MBU5676138.1 polysaccharide deacetylase family protein [Alkaliphilus flagellatus]
MSKKSLLLLILTLIFTALIVRSIYSPNMVKPAGIDNSSISDSTRFAKKIPVLVYHHLLKDEENTMKNNASIISVENFQEQMELLYNEGYSSITLEELEGFILGERELPSRSVLITFDDGYKSNYEYAYPILKEYGFISTIFMITDRISDTTVSFDPTQIQYLSWEEMELSQDVFKFACHTHKLHYLTDDNKSYVVTKPRAEVKEDLRKNLELVHNPYFAYPYGHYTDETIQILHDLEYKMAFTVKEGFVKTGDPIFELNRQGVFPSTTIAKFKIKVGLSREPLLKKLIKSFLNLIRPKH